MTVTATTMITTAVHVPMTEPDIYGQCHPIESAALIEAKLQEFEHELAQRPDSDKADLAAAQAQCAHLLTRHFKLHFLRCEVFHAKLAAQRYCSYWKKRVEIFGRDRAFLSLTLNGALRADHATLLRGFGVSIQTRQRNVLFINPAKLKASKTSRERIAMCRVFWYLIHVALEDETTARQGLIVIGYPHDASFSQFDRKLVQLNISSLRGALPVRLSALHLCRPPAFVSIVFPIVQLFLGERLRQRLHLHTGSVAHVRDRLANWHLPIDELPVEVGGQLQMNVEVFIAERKRLEQERGRL